MASYRKTPEGYLDYGFDWTEWLEEGDTVVTSEWTVPTGITGDNDAILAGGYKTVIWIGGGTSGQKYEFKNKITTQDGRVKQLSLTISIA